MESKYSEPFNMEDDDINFQHTSNSAEDAEFDKIVGILEQILMDPSFTQAQNDFCDRHCDIFEDCKENKLEYTPLFNQYTAMIESFIAQRMAAEIQGFTMKKLEEIISSRQDELSGEVFELLLSLGDFTEFKDLMISQKQAKGAPVGGGGFDLCISGKGAGKGGSSKSSGKGGGGGLDLSISGKRM